MVRASWTLWLGLACVCMTAAVTPGPVVIVPGDGSNQLEAKLDKPSTHHFWCSKKSDWYRIWLSASLLLPKAVDCWCDNIRLVVNATTGRATNAPGVQTRVPYFGSTKGLEELDPSLPRHLSGAFYNMVQAMLAANYTRDTNLRGAPYDFRYTPDSTETDFGGKLKELIESTAKESNQKVTLMSHSMGGLQVLYFLQQQSQEWKDTHIQQWVAISAPWLGSVKELRLMATGDNEGLPVSPNTIRGEQRSYETNVWMMPHARWGNKTLVRTSSRTYTASDYDAFFEDIGYPQGKLVHPRVSKLLADPTKGPGVPVSCMYSTGVKTAEEFDYSNKGWDKNPVIINGDGDGTVNLESLRVCADWWPKTQKQRVTVQSFPGVDHLGMIKDAKVIKAVLLQLLSDHNQLQYESSTVGEYDNAVM